MYQDKTECNEIGDEFGSMNGVWIGTENRNGDENFVRNLSYSRYQQLYGTWLL